MRATPLVWEGVDEGYLDEVNRAMGSAEADPGSVGKAIRYRKMVVASDIETDPSHPLQTRSSGARIQVTGRVCR